MSRTYRRKNVTHDYDWVLRDYLYNDEINDIDSNLDSIVEHQHGYMRRCGEYHESVMYRIHYSPKSKRGKKEIAKYHADATETMNGNGPSWFKRMTSTVPNRRHAKRELKKFMMDNEYEPMIRVGNKPKQYWW